MKPKLAIITILILIPLNLRAAEPNVLINEIAWMGTAASANDEWLELSNQTQADIDLTGWRLEADDGSPKIELAGVISAGGYFLLERTDDDTVLEVAADQIYSGALGNTGEWLKLYNSSGNLIDELKATDAWPGGDNTTKQTLERAATNSWQTSDQPGGTPKAKNGEATQNPPPDEELAENSADEPSSNPLPTGTSPQKGQIIINEVFPNPQNGDSRQEFIELKNTTAAVFDLTDYKITNAAKQNFIIPSLVVTGGCIFSFDRRETNLALNNASEKITLYDKNGKIIDQLSYKNAPAGQSYQKNDEDKWSWENATPGQENTFKIQIMPQALIYGPKAAEINQLIFFDGSDSFDPQRRQLFFRWDFGDGQTATNATSSKTYLAPGNYQVSLTAYVNDQASSTQVLSIKITDPNAQTKASTTPTTTPDLTDNPIIQIPDIFISEFLPNPTGSDDAEFIEVFSEENAPFDLAGFKLDDEEGGSKPFIIPADTIIRPGQYLAFFRTQTKLALNNDTDAVRLLTPTDQIIDYYKYDGSKEGVSYVLDEDRSWQQSDTPTPGEINVLQLPAEAEATTTDTSAPKVLGAQLNSDNPPTGQPTNKTKYIFAGISALVVLGAGVALKLKKKV